MSHRFEFVCGKTVYCHTKETYFKILCSKILDKFMAPSTPSSDRARQLDPLLMLLILCVHSVAVELLFTL